MTNRVYIILISILSVLSLFLGYMLYSTKKELTERIVYVDKQNGTLIDERDGLQMELEQMQSTFSEMETDNKQMQDSIQWQTNRIAKLLASARNKDFDIKQLRDETATLRRIMKGYIHDIDSLQRMNDRLIVEKQNESDRANRAETQSKQLANELSTTQDVVSKGSVLSAAGFSNKGIKEKSRGGEKDVERASQASQIKSCFTIRQNSIVKSGTKKIYMRVESPSGQLIGNAGSANLDGQSTAYSAMREIDYQNQDTDVCMYCLASGLTKGTYKISIYEGGKKIGQSDLVFSR
jgi:FtsZ-binding cell division protein ZapB